MLSDALDEKGYDYRMNPKAVGYCTLKFASYFSAEVAFIRPFCNRPADTLINTRSREVLGIEYARPVKECLLELAESLMKSGQIPTKLK